MNKLISDPEVVVKEIADNRFWLKYAKDAIGKSVTVRSEAASKLEKLTLWFWGIYTASFTIGVTINVIDAPPGVLILLSLPIVFVITTYWFCVLAQMPVTSKFNSRIPEEIIKGYNNGLKIRNRRFNAALIFTFLSALSLSIALFSLGFVNKKSNVSVESFYDKELKSIVISGVLPKGTVALTTIDTLANENNRIIIFSKEFKVQDNGIISFNKKLKKLPKSTMVCITWEEKGQQKGIAQRIK